MARRCAFSSLNRWHSSCAVFKRSWEIVLIRHAAVHCYKLRGRSYPRNEAIKKWILCGHQVESDLSPITAECRPISACSTQNKAKRTNKIVFLLLIRDQEVEGSNPFAPTILFPVESIR